VVRQIDYKLIEATCVWKELKHDNNT
jgi:hypothetical protein